MIVNSATSTAPSPLFDRINEQPPGLVRDWIVEHKCNYVAHAIFSANVKAILQAGFLASAEEIIRTQGTVEYEKGSMRERGTEQFPKLTEGEIAQIKAVENQFTYRNKYSYGIVITRQSYADQDDYALAILEDPPKEAQAPFVACRFIGLCSITRAAMHIKMEEIASNHGCSLSAVAMAYDQSKPLEERIDVILSKIYPLFSEDIPKADYIKRQVRQAFIGARQSFIPPTKLNDHICTTKNAIAWSYGKVVVLRGRADQVVGYEASNGEHCLLFPWQNGGKFFRLNLADPENLVIGPRAELEPHVQVLVEKKIPFQYFENMTREEKLYFSVPS